jgi:hypothetical protein
VIFTLLVAQYMGISKFQILYNAVEPECPEDTVGHIWSAILTFYFPQLEFIHCRYARPVDSSMVKRNADFNIQCILGDKGTLHVALVDKRVFSDLEAPQASWEEAFEHLTDYMIQTRKEDKKKLDIDPTNVIPYNMYGIVSVGKHSRFYVLKPTDDTPQTLPSGGAKALHVRDDELEIVAILKELVAKTIPYGFSSSPCSSLPSSALSSAASSRQASPAPVS